MLLRSISFITLFGPTMECLIVVRHCYPSTAGWRSSSNVAVPPWWFTAVPVWEGPAPLLSSTLKCRGSDTCQISIFSTMFRCSATVETTWSKHRLNTRPQVQCNCNIDCIHRVSTPFCMMLCWRQSCVETRLWERRCRILWNV